MYLENFTLLYVEDEINSRELLSSILEDEVKELFVASNGKEGLELFEKHKPDIVLTDIAMPIMNGIEMSKKIREINSNVPIAILTAFNEPEYLNKAIDLKIEKYILKPIEHNSFFDSLDSIAKVLQYSITEKALQRIIEAQSKTAALGEMISNIAHQWRQPLSVITSLITSLHLDVELEKEITKERITNSSNEILKQAKYLSQTIDDFISFLQTDNSKREKLSIKSVVESSYNLVKESMRNEGIVCVQDVDDVMVEGNRNILIQSLLNIYNNSREAIIKNKIDERYFFITVKKEGNSVIITIKDSGDGMDEEVLGKIFEPYFTTKHQFMGTGIGLYLTWKHITKNLKGTIEVKNINFEYKSKKLKGAQFVISIPASY